MARLLHSLLLLVTVLSLTGQAYAAEIRGTVLDPEGAPVARARVIVSFPGLDRKEYVTANAAGEFLVAPLPEGRYHLRVTADGFRALERPAPASPMTLTLERGPSEPESGVPVRIAPGRYRVSGGTQGRKLIHVERVVYPADCKQERVEGDVLLRAVIAHDGTVFELAPLNQIIDPRLVEAASRAVRLWRYQPTLVDGEPVAIETEIHIGFFLK
ncbi:MAG: carboxypeptidase regulatory-like domain-containing protein [Bryobacter sp.]|nr:carboxypeptidase regulatory-like domain-containing protein [Bryobacter sp.]